MTRSFFYTLGCALALGGCALEIKPDLGEAFGSDDDVAGKSDFFSRNVHVQGTIGYGERIAGTYAERGYAGYTFTGRRGATVIIDLTAGGANDPVLHLYGPKIGEGWGNARRVARNDDWHGTLDSHIEVRLPADGTYLILAREYWDAGGEFTLTFACGGSECRPMCREGDACPDGSLCERVYCIRAPCPSFCAPAPVETACGGRAGIECPDGQYCDFADDAACGAFDRPGTCRAMPTVCPRYALTVCGCDGREHSNPCYANRAGTDVAYIGSCAPSGACTEEECGPRSRAPNYLCEDGVTMAGPGDCVRGDDGACGWQMISCPEAQACGSRGLAPCPEGQFCNFPIEASCGATDHPGTCATVPTICTREYNPVCGCDGRTYSNRCGANAAGVSVASEGECNPPCRVSGCSGQLCVGADDPGYSTCEWREEYACYRGAECTLQPGGRCGWTMTPELRACLGS